MVRKLEDSWNALKPGLKENSKATPRDGSNVALGTSLAIIITWLLHEVAGVPVPPEVAVAFGSVSGWFVGRKFRY